MTDTEGVGRRDESADHVRRSGDSLRIRIVRRGRTPMAFRIRMASMGSQLITFGSVGRCRGAGSEREQDAPDRLDHRSNASVHAVVSWKTGPVKAPPEIRVQAQ